MEETPQKLPYRLRNKTKNAAPYRSLIRPELADELYDKIMAIVVLQKKYKDPNYTAKKLAEKTIMVSDLLKDFNFTANKKYKVAVHKPCHDTYDFIDIVKNINGIEYIEARDFDKCCGFSGKFALQNQEISRKISKQKAQAYLDAKVDFILTTCPACQLGLNQGITEILAENTKEKIPEVMNLFLFLAKYCKTV